MDVRYFKYFSSQPNTVSCHMREFCGFSTP